MIDKWKSLLLATRSTFAKYTCALFLVVVVLASLAQARVTGIGINSREAVADGMSFGASGPYEKLRGTVFFEADPGDPRNAVVFDLDKAPRNDRGMVEFSADFFILKPLDMMRGNQTLFFEPPNDGSKISLRLMNDTLTAADDNPSTSEDFGNGFLLRQGYTLAWVGWQANVNPDPSGNRMTVQFPIAIQDGEPMTELILTEFSDARGGGAEVFTLPLSGSSNFRSYEAVSTNQVLAKAELRVRPSDSPRPPAPDIPEGEVVPTSQWSFARCPDGPPGTPSTMDICVAGGFRNDLVYQLKYKAINSPVMGLGYATVRDFVSFLRNRAADDAGNPNLVTGIRTVLGQGISESAWYFRDFLYQGFNEDENGQRVFDGMNIVRAGVNKLFLNYRFARPGRDPDQHAGRYVPDRNFPMTYAFRKDPQTGRIDGIMKRPDTDPKLMHADSSTEYWQFGSSLVDTDEDGMLDMDQPANVRRYLFSSTQHMIRKGAPASRGIGNRQCQQSSNTTHPGPIARALLVALRQWVLDGVAPPYSHVPRIDDGTLVPSEQESTEFPDIPGVTYNGLFNASGERDFGPHVKGNRGVITKLIPDVLSVHRVLVPKVDEIGNDISGIRHPFVEAPVATLTGWNLRTPEFSGGDLCDLLGMGVPLAKTRDEQLAAGDPRPSLEGMYGDHNGYVLKVADAALNLWAQRLMLLEDVLQTIQEADNSSVLG